MKKTYNIAILVKAKVKAETEGEATRRLKSLIPQETSDIAIALKISNIKKMEVLIRGDQWNEFD